MEGLGKRLEILPDRVLIYSDDADETLSEVHRRGLETETTLVRRSTLEDVFSAPDRPQPGGIGMAPTALRVVEAHARYYRRTWRGSVISSFAVPLFTLVAMGTGLGRLVNDSGGVDRERASSPSWLPGCWLPRP